MFRDDDLFWTARQYPVPDALHRLGIAPKWGTKFRCPSPDHEDRHPSASWYTSGNIDRWKCFSCDCGGSVIDLVVLALGLSPQEAARMISEQWLGRPAVRATLTKSAGSSLYIRRPGC